MFLNKKFPSQLITDTATVYISAGVNLEDVFEGSVIFTATGTNVTGTFDVDCQLQGSNSADFSTGVVAIGSPVALADTVTSAVALSVTLLAHAYYRVAITGADTQTTNVVGTVTIKGRD